MRVTRNNSERYRPAEDLELLPCHPRIRDDETFLFWIIELAARNSVPVSELGDWLGVANLIKRIVDGSFLEGEIIDMQIHSAHRLDWHGKPAPVLIFSAEHC